MVNVIPMAGLGSRFAEAGYVLPKPLIPVSGEPMIARVIRSLPSARKSIFIVREEHIRRFGIDRLIKNILPKAIIVPVKETTGGQASSCMLAMPHIAPAESIFITACDNDLLYNEGKFKKLAADPKTDAVVFTFTRDRLLADNPNAWGWAETAGDGITVENISVKKQVSQSPFNDHAITASFYFKKAEEFQRAYAMMAAENYRVRNELYVDALPIFYRKMDKRSVIFDVDLYIGWGKPQDLYNYQSWEYLCRQNTTGMFTENQRGEYKLWKRYFKQSDKWKTTENNH